MAVIGKIQKNSLLLLVVVGGAMLAFIFADAKTWFGGNDKPTAMATIYNQDIDEAELGELNTSFIDNAKRNLYYQGKSAEWDSKKEKEAKDQAFNEYVRRDLMNRELDALGLTVSADELNDMVLGNHIHPWIQQERSFQDAQGNFSKDSCAKYILYLETEPDGIDTMAYNRWMETKAAWKNFESELADSRKADKYVTLIKKGVYVNSLEAKNQYYGAKENRKISYVIKKYTDIAQDEVELTDEELKAYFEEHKNEKQYEQLDESAVVDFVEFTVAPTQFDVDEALSSLSDSKEKFGESMNDIGFIYNKSDVIDEDKLSDSTTYSLGTDKFSFNQKLYPLIADADVQASDSGDVVGPYLTFGDKGEQIAVLLKVKGFESQEQAWVRHILISTGASRTEKAGKKMADSVVNVIKANNNFTEMVSAVSEDPGSVQNGGEYKWFPKGRMVPAFEDASFNGKKGKLQVVKTTYGYHIVEVLDKRNAKLPILVPLIKNVKPSFETKGDIEDIAYDYISDLNEMEGDSAFFEIAKRDSMAVKNSRLTIKYDYVMGFNSEISKSAIKKFAFSKDAVEGDISDPIYDKEDGVYKVAILSSKIAMGTPSFEDVKEQMRFPALRDKQAAKYIEMMSGTGNLQEIVAKMPELRIQTVNVNYNVNTIQGGGGNEPKIVGSVFAIPEGNVNQMTIPIQGESGIYVFIVDEILSAPETTDYIAEQKSLRTGKQANADNLVIRALREKADVIDNRERINVQGR
jgi:peptidyl-prolyl cis-trans isomerase D